MPPSGSWNGCKFEGDPQTVTELLGKAGVTKRSVLNFPYAPDIEFVTHTSIGNERDIGLGVNANTVTYQYNGGLADLPFKAYKDKEDCGVCQQWTHPVAGGGCPISGTSNPASLYETIPIKPCETKVLNYYGMDVDPDTEDGQAQIQGLVKNGEISFRVINQVLKLASFGVAEFAKNDYRKDLVGSKKKFELGKDKLLQGNSDLAQLQGPAVQLGTQLDVLSTQLADIEKALLVSKDKIYNFVTQLDSLNNTLSVQNSALASAQNSLANAKTLQDRIYWQGIVSQTRRDILATRKEIYRVGNENVAESVVHNNLGAEGTIIANEIKVLEPAVDTIKQQAQQASGKMASGQAKMNEASKDVSTAQNTFGNKIEFSINLAQGADGAEGIANGLQAIHAHDYYKSTAEFLKMGVGQVGYYVPFGPYKQLINLTIDEIFRTAGAGGNIENFVYRFLDASLALEAQQKLANDVSIAVNNIEGGGGNEIDAWFGLAKASGDGIKILGRWAEVSAPFTGGVVAQPLIKPATEIASDTVSGLLATCVAMGSRDAFFGKCTPGYRDPRSTCQRPDPSGPIPTWALGLGGVYQSVFNGPAKNSMEIFKGAFGQQVTEVDTVEIIKNLAKSGAGELFDRAPSMRFDVSLRPTKPTNTPGFYPPGDYSGTPIYGNQEWDQKQNITAEEQ